MGESWTVDDSGPAPTSAERVRALLADRISRGQRETWLTSSSGRRLGFVTNAERAAVLLLDGVDDPGEHAVDPGATGHSGGFVLANGQYDDYPDRDTVPLDEAFRVVAHIVATGSWPVDANRVAD